MLDIEIAKLRKDLRAVVARGADEPAAVRARLRDALEREAMALLPALSALGDRFDPEALHEQRRRVRRLRYAAEVGEALRGGEAKGGGRPFKKLQTALGRIHDHALFSAWLARLVDTAGAKGETAVRAEAEALRARVDEAARALHREMLANRPKEMVRRALESLGSSRSAA
jgi:CHAD domain-containing protein